MEKPEIYKSDHHDTWEPLQILRINEIKTGILKNFRLFSDADPHLLWEQNCSHPLTVLYWTEIDHLHLSTGNLRNNIILEHTPQILIFLIIVK